MKASMMRLTPVYNTNRMVREYTESYYLPALNHWGRLSRNEFQAAKALARWKERVRHAWPGVRIVEIKADDQAEMHVGQNFSVRCIAALNGLEPQDVLLELYYGPLDPFGGLGKASRRALRYETPREGGLHEFAGEVPCGQSGKMGYAVRVLPHHPNLASHWDLGLVVWS
jgi:starch phosphorylase